MTVDPVRDTPAVLSSFVQGFLGRGHALRTDDEAELQQIVDAFGATSVAEHDPAGNTTDVGHTDHTYLLDDQGHVVVTWTADMTVEDLTNDLEILLRSL